MDKYQKGHHVNLLLYSITMLMRINAAADFGHVYYLIVLVVFLPKKLES